MKQQFIDIFVGLIMLGLLAGNPASADTPTVFGGIPAPKGLMPCEPNDPVASVEARVAPQLGLEFLSCFQSDRTIAMPMPRLTKAPRVPIEYAFALAIQGGGYTPADLDNLMSRVEEQWKGFNPGSKEFKGAYMAWLNEVIKNNGSIVSPNIVSVKPVLLSIVRADDHYYTVTSIRTYVFESNGEHVTFTKVNSDALVLLSNSHLIRLTILRTLSDPADVTQVQGEINNWALAAAQSSLPTTP